MITDNQIKYLNLFKVNFDYVGRENFNLKQKIKADSSLHSLDVGIVVTYQKENLALRNLLESKNEQIKILKDNPKKFSFVHLLLSLSLGYGLAKTLK